MTCWSAGEQASNKTLELNVDCFQELGAVRVTWGMTAKSVGKECGLSARFLFKMAFALIRFQSRQGRRYPSRTSLKILQYSADHGHVQAMSQLGRLLYCSGVGRVDKRSGLEYLRQAARGGDINAQFWLGSAHLDGQLVRQDDKTAVHWLTLAAERGHAEAASLLQACKARSSASVPLAEDACA